MSKFTDGEWVADDMGEYIFSRTPEGLMSVAQMRGWGYLTGTLNLTPDEAIEVQKANARLIASAPKMYELLREELIPTSDYGGILSFARSKKVSELLAYINGEVFSPRRERKQTPEGKTEQAANCRLIASAPEMYELLKAVVDYKPDFIWDVVSKAQELLERINGKEVE